MAYTVAVREKGKGGPYSYVDQDLKVRDVATYCKPLTLAEARLAKRCFIEDSLILGRPLEARIVVLAK